MLGQTPYHESTGGCREGFLDEVHPGSPEAFEVLPSPSSLSSPSQPSLSQRDLATYFLAVSLDLQSTKMFKT